MSDITPRRKRSKKRKSILSRDQQKLFKTVIDGINWMREASETEEAAMLKDFIFNEENPVRQVAAHHIEKMMTAIQKGEDPRKVVTLNNVLSEFKQEEDEKEPPKQIEGEPIELGVGRIVSKKTRASRYTDDEDPEGTKFPEGLRIRDGDEEDPETTVARHRIAGLKWVPEEGDTRRLRHLRNEMRELLRQEDHTDEFNRDFNVSV